VIVFPIVLIGCGITVIIFRKRLGEFKASIDSEWGLRVGSHRLYTLAAAAAGCGLILGGVVMIVDRFVGISR
jgi:ribosomal protein S5